MKSKKDIKRLRMQIHVLDKNIKIEGQYNLRKTVKAIKKILPGNWTEFTMETCNSLDWGENEMVFSDVRRWWHYYRPYEVFYCSNSTAAPTTVTTTHQTVPLSTENTTDTTFDPNVINIEF